MSVGLLIMGDSISWFTYLCFVRIKYIYQRNGGWLRSHLLIRTHIQLMIRSRKFNSLLCLNVCCSKLNKDNFKA